MIMQESLFFILNSLGYSALSRIMFAINKADLMYPNDWNSRINMPSTEQQGNLFGFAQTVDKCIHEIAPKFNGEIKIYSAIKNYRLEDLLTAMMSTAPNKRRWVLDKSADCASPDTYIDPTILAIANERLTHTETVVPFERRA